MFNKTVSAATTCDNPQANVNCTYLDSIRSITLDEYSLKPPEAPVDSAHELLFRINRINGLLYACMSYQYISTIPPYNLVLQDRPVGGPVNPPSGFGRPSVYATVNHVFVGSVPDSFDERTASAAVVPTLFDMIDALVWTKPGSPYLFTYYANDATFNSKITWLPDFPSCDNAGDPTNLGIEYGNVAAELSFEVFQATQ
jgi:hypothetical protein